MDAPIAHILLAEDDEAHVELVRRAFERHSRRFDVNVAGSLAEARTWLAENRPDVVIADLRLPDGRGTDLLRAGGDEAAVPLVVMTGQGDERAAVESMRAGALDYLVKSPEVLADLPHIVERALRELGHIAERKLAQEAPRESEERARRLADENAAIAEIGRIVNSSLETGEIYERFAAEVGKLIPFDRIELSTVDLKERTFANTYVVGPIIPGRPQGQITPLAGTYTEGLIEARSGLLIQSQSEEQLRVRYPSTSPGFQVGFRSFLGAPLVSKDEIVGVLVLTSKAPDAFTRADLALAERVAAQITGAVTNADLFARHVRAEEALRESEAKLHRMFESVSEGIVVADLNGVITEVNERRVRMHGFDSRDELLGKTVFDSIAPADRERAKLSRQKLLEEGVVRGQEFAFLRADGTEFPGEFSGSLLTDASGNPAGFIGIIRDITERKRAEEALRESEARFRTSVDSMLDCFGIFSAVRDGAGRIQDFRVEYVNAAACASVSQTIEEVVGKSVVERWPDVRATGLFDAYCELVETGEPLRVEPVVFGDMGVDGRSRTRVMDVRASKLGDGYAVVWRDITGRKRAEEALRESEERFRRVFEESPVGIGLTGEDLRLIGANKAFCQMLGYAEEELVGSTIAELTHPEDLDLSVVRARGRSLRGSVEAIS